MMPVRGETKYPGTYGQKGGQGWKQVREQIRREMLVKVTEGDGNTEEDRRQPRMEPWGMPVSGEETK